MKKALLIICTLILSQSSHAVMVDMSRMIYPSLTNANEWTETTDDGFTLYKKSLGGLTCTQSENEHNTCEIDVFQKNAKLIYDNLSAFELIVFSYEYGHHKTMKHVGNLVCTHETSTVFEEYNCYFSNY